ncbi:MAG: hypothetical protein GY878_18315 [Fuerstiella sp.]|nr:hypothetical protein [Fuerstiella sp.]
MLLKHVNRGHESAKFAAVILLALMLNVEVHAAAAEYTYSCWLNGWRKNANDQSDDIFGIETSQYGLTLDVADFRKVGFGHLHNPAGYEYALKHKADKLRQLPPAEFLIELEVDGVHYRARACRAGREEGVKRLSNVRLWESGRYVQHYDFPGLDFRTVEGRQLACDAILDVVAWPGSLTLNLHVSPTAPVNSAVLRLALTSDMGSWSKEKKVEGTWQQGEKQSVSLHCPVASSRDVPPENITVTAANDQRFPVRFDVTRNCYVASVNRLKRSWRTGYTDIRHYDDFRITIKGSGSKRAVPFLLDLRPPANITGLCPILCDESGRPAGIPVQLSKNWHYKPMGSYLMAYAMLPAEKDTTYLLRVVYGFYGTLPSASHAQLSLLGYGGHGRWDQLAIGCWGETICFDMDMSLVDVAVTDIRALMVRSGIEGTKWGWTNAGWGGDWLNIQDDDQEKYFQNSLKTAYLSHGPCLTDVKHEGYYGANREVDFSARIQTLRTDDYCRTFQKLNYTFTHDVSAKKIWLFKLGRTHSYQTPGIAYGNIDGLIEQRTVPGPLKKGQMFLNNVELTGPGPHWVAFTGAAEISDGKPKPNGYRALIIRQYKAVIGARTYANPVISSPVHKAAPTNLDVELLPPAGVRRFSKGDRIELDLELITLPRVADDYYGPNEAFRQHLSENPNTWKTTFREVEGNRLEVTVSGGTETQNYPLVIKAEEPEVTVAIKGGVGAVPIRFEGLATSQGYQLYRVVSGERIGFEQSVHGNDFWQTDFDAATETYRMSFNLPLDESSTSKWVLAQ